MGGRKTGVSVLDLWLDARWEEGVEHQYAEMWPGAFFRNLTLCGSKIIVINTV